MGAILTICVRSANEAVDAIQSHVNGELDEFQESIAEASSTDVSTQTDEVAV